MQQGTCTACHRPDQRLTIATGDCDCLICETCANAFLDANQCGVCGTIFTEEELGDDTDDH